MSPRNLSQVLVLGWLTSVALHGGVVPGRWEKLDSLEPGSKILLVSQAGDTVLYTFQSANSTSLTVRARDGRDLVIPKSHVTRVIKRNSRSSKQAWIGTAIGAGTGFALGALGSRGADEGPFARWEVAGISLGAVGALTGFTIGYFTAENPPDDLVYERATQPVKSN